MNSTSGVCLYPLSPAYLPIHRYLYYVALAISVLYPTPPPFIKGAFAYSLTYSATASLYAILVVAKNTSPVVNLDIFGLWAVLSPACTLLLPLLNWNKNLNSSNGKSARSIVRIWGVWVTIGMICTLVVMIHTQKLAKGSELALLASESCQNLARIDELKFKLRDPRTAEQGRYNELFGSTHGHIINITPVLTFIPLFFGFVSCLITIKPARPKVSGDVWTGICVSSSEGTFSAGSATRAGYLGLQRMVLIISPAFFIAVVVLDEKFLLKAWIPAAEEMYEVGQWGLLAGLVLVSAAAIVNWIVGKMLGEVRAVFKGSGGDDSEIIV